MAYLPPIGIFDSGVGGLTVLKEVSSLMPTVPLIYYADQVNCPYGSQPLKVVKDYVKSITDFLLSRGCQLVVVACNTATAAAIEYLRARYEILFVGMEPAVKPACLLTKTKQVGILATKGTFEGKLFLETSAQYRNDAKLHLQIGNGLVELVENMKMNTPEAILTLQKYLMPLLTAGVDQLVLGCTHYPFLKSDMLQIVGNSMNILDPAPAIAKQVKKLYEYNFNFEHKENQPTYHFFTSGDKAFFKRFLKKVDISYSSVEKV